MKARSILVMITLVALLLSVANASLADNTGITIIWGPEEAEQSSSCVDLSDLKPNQLVSVPGYADFRIEKVEFTDWVEHTYDLLDTEYGFSSGDSADYLHIRLWILNTGTEPHDFYNDFSDIVCDFAYQYRFGGWLRQVSAKAKVPYASEDDHREIEPLYEGLYDLFVTLPNHVVESKEPLSVSFSLADSEITCNVRR